MEKNDTISHTFTDMSDNILQWNWSYLWKIRFQSPKTRFSDLLRGIFFFSFAACRPNNNLPCSWHALSWQEACTSISVLWKSNILLSLASFWNDHNNSKSLTRTAPPKQNVCPAFFLILTRTTCAILEEHLIFYFNITNTTFLDPVQYSLFYLQCKMSFAFLLFCKGTHQDYKKHVPLITYPHLRHHNTRVPVFLLRSVLYGALRSVIESTGFYTSWPPFKILCYNLCELHISSTTTSYSALLLSSEQRLERGRVMLHNQVQPRSGAEKQPT